MEAQLFCFVLAFVSDFLEKANPELVEKWKSLDTETKLKTDISEFLEKNAYNSEKTKSKKTKATKSKKTNSSDSTSDSSDTSNVTENESSKKVNSYIMFCRENRMILKNENQDLSAKDITAMLSKKWNEIKEQKEQLEHYQKLALEENVKLGLEKPIDPDMEGIEKIEKPKTKKKPSKAKKEVNENSTNGSNVPTWESVNISMDLKKRNFENVKHLTCFEDDEESELALTKLKSQKLPSLRMTKEKTGSDLRIPRISAVAVKTIDDQIEMRDYLWNELECANPTVIVYNSKGMCIKSNHLNEDAMLSLAAKAKSTYGATTQIGDLNSGEVFFRNILPSQLLQLLKMKAYNDANQLVAFKHITLIVTKQAISKPDLLKSEDKVWYELAKVTV